MGPGDEPSGIATLVDGSHGRLAEESNPDHPAEIESPKRPKQYDRLLDLGMHSDYNLG
jgi:hypothetical protein